MKYTSSVFEWANVEYGVGVGKKSKEILKGISGSLNGGEVCAILGPSGSGKTSLLNVLANRIRHKGASQRVSGSVLLDGKKLVGGELRKRIAYVMQIDLLFATSTPREAIMFSATLRLPRSTPMSEKRELVEKMIVDMGLQSCANTFCGDDMIRGISGGEKKRTAIGIELVMKPQLIFLDEPTSGLDSFSAKSVCLKLMELGRTQGCNILCTIHQPASEVFHTFQKALIVQKGHCLYYGSIKGLSAGLAQHGLGCPSEYNMADHIITLTQTLSAERLDELRHAFLGHVQVHETPTLGVKIVPSEVELTSPSSSMKVQPSAEATAAEMPKRSSPDPKGRERAAGFWRQLYALTIREALYVWRNKPGLIASILAPLILNAVFACIFEGVGDITRPGYNLQAHFGASAQVLIGGMFGAAQPLLLRFPLDRGIFLREYATSTYSAAPYFLSKTMVELPQAFLNAVLVWCTFYFIADLQGSWILHVCIFWLAGICAGSTALLVGCLASNPEVAQQCAPPLFVLQLLFAGVFVRVTQIPPALRWIQWIASLKYAINLNVLNEFGERTQKDKDWPMENRIAADEFIDQVIDVDPSDWWWYLLMLFLLFLVFRVLSIFALAWRASTFF